MFQNYMLTEFYEFMKILKTIPEYRKVPKEDIENYRPVTSMCNFS